MNRDDAYTFIKLYRKFQATGLKIVDLDNDSIELQAVARTPADPLVRLWVTDTEAARLIETFSK